MAIAKHYNPGEIEEKWYSHWDSSGYFHEEPDDREPFSIVIPPPNVTGVLHMGHMLNNTVQDILARKARMDGKNVCWAPGTDHASIATEAKVVRMLREKGVKKSDIGRGEFLKIAGEWSEEYEARIIGQLKKLGVSCDWQRTAFTLDETRSAAVIDVFVDLYRKGKIYRGLRMINWDPEAQTVLSNEEVLYDEEDSVLYQVDYQLLDSDQTITIATTRPETILGDTAIAVHPKDQRYTHLVGKHAIVPVVGRQIPIIADDYVDREFGTGALKITPAHDPNDYEIGLRHALEVIDVLNADGTMAEIGGYFVGQAREDAREAMVQRLKDVGQLRHKEVYRHSVGRSERTHVVVEPRLSLQWFVDMKSLAAPALAAVLSNEVQFFPRKYQNIYTHWMENIRDWCISRQLWWGQRIPAYYLEGVDEVFVASSAEEALEQARQSTGRSKLTLDNLRQDDDVVDTWFSSWLWPITVFDGFNSSRDFDYYYPTSVLVTGWDIIFLWVARMIIAGYEWKSERPFDHVYFTGMVRDRKGRKMSKSLGNSPDALKLIDDFGADGVRFGILSSAPAGGDLLFDEKLCEQGKNFCNKIWNALRLVKSWEANVDNALAQSDKNKLAVRWVEARLADVLKQSADQFTKYRLSEILIELYKFIWSDFCSWYLEMVKPAYGRGIDQPTYEATISVFERACAMLHPYMPFVTEEVWHQLRDRAENDDCMQASYPMIDSSDGVVLNKVSSAKDVISRLREVRNSYGVAQSQAVVVHAPHTATLFHAPGIGAMIKRLANVSGIQSVDEIPDTAIQFVVGALQLGVDLPIERNIEEERGKLWEELEYQKKFLASVEKKLANERFVQNAPPAVVDKERKKLADGRERIAAIEEALKRL